MCLLNTQIAQPQFAGSTLIRVLIADPDKSLLVMYRQVLSKDGFDVGTAPTGLECIARLREGIPDVLVLDPQVPWGGGDGVLAMMAEMPELASVPVMVLTASRELLVSTGIAQFSIFDWHVKPVAPDRLVKGLRNLLDHYRLRCRGVAKQKRARNGLRTDMVQPMTLIHQFDDQELRDESKETANKICRKQANAFSRPDRTVQLRSR